MTQLERQLLRHATDGVEPRICIRTATRVDTGRWWRPTPVWLCVMADELVLLSVSRRRYLERVALDECRATRYCHATGQLVIEPTESLTFPHLAMSPKQALAVLAFFTDRKRTSDSQPATSESLAAPRIANPPSTAPNNGRKPC